MRDKRTQKDVCGEATPDKDNELACMDQKSEIENRERGSRIEDRGRVIGDR